MPGNRKRIWIAGPRAWENKEFIDRLVAKVSSNYGIARLLIMTGGAPGVDHLVEEVCIDRGIHCFRCRACWPTGRHAGPVRNAVIAEEFEPELLVALHYYPLTGTYHRGTRNAIKQAGKWDVPVRKVRVRPHVAMPSSVDAASPLGNRARTEQGLAPRAKKRRSTPSKARKAARDA